VSKVARKDKTTQLTEQQELFCREYVKDLNATQAAIRAGYSEKGAFVRGCELLKLRKVADRVAALKQKSFDRIETESDMLLRQLVDECTADIADIIDEQGNLKPIKEWPLVWRQGLVSGIDVQRMVAAEDAETIVHKIRLADRTRVKELLGKHIKVLAWKEVVQNDASDALVEKLEKAMARASGLRK
jgi:phage terminase small subunit